MGDVKLSKDKDFIYEEVDYSSVGIKKIIIKGIGEYSGQKGLLINETGVN